MAKEEALAAALSLEGYKLSYVTGSYITGDEDVVYKELLVLRYDRVS